MTTTPVARSLHTACWARTMTRWLIRWVNRRGAQWEVVGFEGSHGRESRGIVDLMVVRKDHGRPPAGLKGGDRLDIVLVQVKGGGAPWPTDDDVRRLRAVTRLHRASTVVLSVWKQGLKPVFYKLRLRRAAGPG